MTFLKPLFLIAAVLLPALAQADTMKDPAKMTCAEFKALDKDAMAKAIEAMHMAGPDAAMAMDAPATEAAMMATSTHCEGNPDSMAMDAMMMK